MGLAEEREKELLKQHHELAKGLNLDKLSSNEAWKSFSTIYDGFLLEGDPTHWLGCAIYVACRNTTTPTVGKSNVLVQGNQVSLARLLKHINLSLVDFFPKIKKWCVFVNMSEDFLKKINQLERNFTVSVVIFKKFHPIFSDMFLDPVSEASKSLKSKKYKTQPATLWRIFEFTWTLYIFVKSRYPKISDDLVNSYYLLLSCCDFIFVNAVMSGRRDLINEDFPDVSTEARNSKFPDTAPDVPCIIDHLCFRHNGTAVEAKEIKEYSWKKHIKSLFDKRILKGNNNMLCDILENNYFEYNFKTINRYYEEYVLSAGDFDERIFLGCTLSPETTSPNELVLHDKLNNVADHQEATNIFNIRAKAIFLTPLTGRKYLEPKEVASTPETRASYASHSMTTLQTMLCGREPVPSETLLKYIMACSTPPPLQTNINEMGNTLLSELSNNTESDLFSIEIAEACVILTKKLYYKLMDSILAYEAEKSSFDANTLLSQDIFHKTLYSCAVEVVLFSYNYNQGFLWILRVLDITPYHFYRIIEIVVRNESVLTREIVKHLNTIEETILERLAWQSESPLWKGMIHSGLLVPSCEDVTTQSLSNNYSEFDLTKQSAKSSGDKLTFLAGKESILANSPGAPLSERFLSPNPNSLKRKAEDSPELFDGQSPLKVLINQKTSDSILQVFPSATKDNSKNTKENRKPRRTGAIALFFRKFYYLASVRVLDVCDQLKLTDSDLRRKIWTCFELSIVNHVGLMLDRHLDQILMCAVYVICKIVGPDKTFTDIMKCYRNQPQAQSSVYRDVLVAPDVSFEDLKSNPTAKSQEERGDLIKFYNTVYVEKMKDLVLRFKGEKDERVVLSPIPVSKSIALNSPRRVSEKHAIFLRTLGQEKLNSPNCSGGVPLSYCFSRSPAKDLKAINNMVKNDALRVGKRLYLGKEDENVTATDNTTGSGAFTRKVHGLFVDRLAARAQE